MNPRTFRALILVMITPPMVWLGVCLALWLHGAAKVAGLAAYSALALAIVAYAVYLVRSDRHQRVLRRPDHVHGSTSAP